MTQPNSKMPEYTIWAGIKGRCLNPKNLAYRYYGGRGITICARWKNSFKAFIDDMGPRPSPRHSIDRINNDGHYEPGNCRWALPREQAANTRKAKAYRNAILAEFSEIYGPQYILADDDQLRRELAQHIQAAGSLRAVAKQIGVSGSYLSFVMMRKSPPSVKVAKFLGYELNKAPWVRARKDDE